MFIMVLLVRRQLSRFKHLFLFFLFPIADIKVNSLSSL